MEIDTATFTAAVKVLLRLQECNEEDSWLLGYAMSGESEITANDRRWLHGALAEACRDNNIPPLDTITGMIAALETVETEDA